MVRHLLQYSSSLEEAEIVGGCADERTDSEVIVQPDAVADSDAWNTKGYRVYRRVPFGVERCREGRVWMKGRKSTLPHPRRI